LTTTLDFILSLNDPARNFPFRGRVQSSRVVGATPQENVRGNVEFQMLGGTYQRDVEVPKGESAHPFLIPPLADDTEVLIQFIEGGTGEWFYSDVVVLSP
jgi:hypothetical protein